MQILVTGGMGFIGSHLIRLLLETLRDVKVVNLDIMSYAANPRNVAYIRNIFADRYEFVHGDICDPEVVGPLLQESQAVFHLAAESHVDRSLKDSGTFMRTNVLGSNNLMQCALRLWGNDPARRFIQVSTDEVYGSLALEDNGGFKESNPLQPRSPYSVSKASGDMLALAFYHSFGLPVIITRASNNYGPHQYPEKLIPLMIMRALAGMDLPVYGDGLYVRDWLFVKDHCRALIEVWRQGEPGQVYNIGANNQRSNLEIVDMVISNLSRRFDIELAEFKKLIRHVEDRPGHDRRYALDCGKIEKDLGFQAATSLDEGLDYTINWYFNHADWWGEPAETQLWPRR